jgi:hypothetical protein
MDQPSRRNSVDDHLLKPANLGARRNRYQPSSELADVLRVDPPIDSTSTNAWEGSDFLAAVRTTGRRKLIMCARPAGAQPLTWSPSSSSAIGRARTRPPT